MEAKVARRSKDVTSLRPRVNTTCTIRKYKLIVFDLDGVVIDSVADIVAAARYSLQLLGSERRDFAFIRSCIGGGARNLLLRCLDENSRERVDEALSLFKEYYEQNCTNQTTLFPGVLDVLAFYAGKKQIALATFKVRSATLKILAELKALNYFDLIVTADDVHRPKPDPECVQRILETLRCRRDEAIMVGDTPTDISTGKNAGVATCAVSYGIGTLEELKGCKPDFIIENIQELKEIVVI